MKKMIGIVLVISLLAMTVVYSEENTELSLDITALQTDEMILEDGKDWSEEAQITA